ncbi:MULTISPECIES: S8 family peptidase [Aeromonas]|uniref:S8 family peptidase n=1 Tax=Aeromonas TaxID=642 RepID=UPI000CD48EE1|nr:MULTISPECIES: S8 family serine peptidase [Aeromonas]MCX0427298.1 S8 family serine peptidase [Aeromonas veronii]MCX0447395.1 S8 family serine peptidase [Aeromonas veronii]POG17587.1 peptidase S8 [Aeromonas veronii]CAD7559995.1 hypothetical protein KBAHV01_44120 [Aeromonas hydrophila]HDX8611247.1 S8 family serine peptidase [Aeromonas hydrophila]
MEKYVVLRDVTSVSRQLKRGMPLGGLQASSAKPQLKIEIENVPAHALAELRNDPQVRSAEPVIGTHLIKPFFSREPAIDGDSWGIAAVGADISPYTGDGVTVAVLDTGIEADHPAFKGMVLDVEDFTGTGKHDGNGHGTHCAGTIFGRDVGGRRIGVARGVKNALIGKVLGDDGGGSSEMIFQALHWALEKRANVISMSLGFDFPGTVKHKVDAGWPVDLATSQALEAYRGNLRMFDALMAMFKASSAFKASPVVIAAAGNESRREVDTQYKISASVPAAADGVISVAAAHRLDATYGIADFSNSLARVAAPGVDVLSAWPGGKLHSLNGTSMACPHVAGVAALWWERAVREGVPTVSDAVSAHLTSTARQLFAAQYNSSDFGFGLITSPT